MVAVPEDFEGDFEHAYRSHFPALQRRSRRLFPAQEADDAVQETFLRAWARHGGRDPGMPWLLTVLRNLAIDRSRRKPVEPVADMEKLDSPVQDSPADKVIQLEDARAVRRAMEGLTPAQQQALRLREWHGMSNEQIAARLQTTVPSVESLLVRGRRRLRGALEGIMGLIAWPATSLWRRMRGLPQEHLATAAPSAPAVSAAVAQLATAAAVFVASVSGGAGAGDGGERPEPLSRDRVAAATGGGGTEGSTAPLVAAGGSASSAATQPGVQAAPTSMLPGESAPMSGSSVEGTSGGNSAGDTQDGTTAVTSPTDSTTEPTDPGSKTTDPKTDEGSLSTGGDGGELGTPGGTSGEQPGGTKEPGTDPGTTNTGGEEIPVGEPNTGGEDPGQLDIGIGG